MSERAYLNLYTREAMAKTLALRDEQIDRLEEENARLREYIEWLEGWALSDPNAVDIKFEIEMKQRELGIKGD